MPQLDFLTFPSQIIWLFITFTALYIIMAKIALPKLANAIELRRDIIARDLEEAEHFKDESEKAEIEYESLIKEAHSKSNVIIKETKEKLSLQFEKEKKKVEEDNSKKIIEAESKILNAKNNALSQIDSIATDISKTIVEKLVGSKGLKVNNIEDNIKLTINN
ncbi:MAG: F0F1 ATP synthase subunit B' [Rhodobiaceae bacterium]|jgi:F-type H+-transporting ATPase subunit b|nr:F0F1 ATP synthase subunit B' [Rhodobiaceae bacterium]MBT5640950.1 F0F1 ATP synthase subunit B' [Rhodobiaceae bacterium]MBT6222816.1 F0F1 ATP synthase subunit B' [Rhodobiaceae bacterium]